jgi:AcrR family transcriptional regulator
MRKSSRLTKHEGYLIFCQVPNEPKRRVPSQPRSRRRYEAIVEAAAELFSEIGYDKTTTDAVAERASTSVGSIYQFFGGKEDLFRAVAHRCLERSEAAFERLHGDGALKQPWRRLVDSIVDGFVFMAERDPGFQAISKNQQLYHLFEKEDLALHRQFIEHSSEVLRHYAPHLDQKERDVVATMINQVVSSALFFYWRSSPETRGPMIQETKTLLHRYLEPLELVDS